MVSILNSMFQDAVNRRGLLRASLAGLVSQLLMPAAQAAKTLYYSESVIFDQELPPVSLANWTVRVVALEFPAGGPPAPAHRHPGFVLGYVLEGAVWFQMQDQPKRRLSAGQVFYEPPGAIHLTTCSASNTHPAKAIALVFGEREQDLSLPVQRQEIEGAVKLSGRET
ncbi:cupin domain-containing protein [Myxosarcina sp. GI1(2024)]